MKVKDLTETLPRHPTKAWATRPRNRIERIVVHQSLSKASVHGINKYHITPGPLNHLSKTGAPKIAYHYAIDAAGAVYKLNNLEDKVWHTRGANVDGVGVCVLGNFWGKLHTDGVVGPTMAALQALGALCKALKAEVPSIKEVNTHSDFGKPGCPGYLLEGYVKQLSL